MVLEPLTDKPIAQGTDCSITVPKIGDRVTVLGCPGTVEGKNHEGDTKVHLNDGSFIYPQPHLIKPESSITPPVIEQDLRSPSGSSITLGTYIRRRGDREYEYWRLSWRVGKRIFHRHIPSSKLNQVRAALVAQKSHSEVLRQLGD